jgi:polysaccharide export outer membrane protein
MRLWRVLIKALFGLLVVLGLLAGTGLALAAAPPPGGAAQTTTGAVAAAVSHAASDAAKASSTKAKETSPDSQSAYVLGTGDKLHINVFGQHDLDGNYLVDGSGNIQFPLIGQVKAAGKTVPQLQNTLIAALSKGFLVNPSVSIEVTSARPFYILGEVKAPGQYPYVMGMSVITAVALAGGYTFRADESDVYIRRAGADKEKEYPASEKTKVQPGDIIRVPERFF